jgi:phosphoglycerol transferase MdoB-like AlkP superfamily enzyme
MEAAILPKHQSRKRHGYQNHKTGGGVTIKTSKQEGHHYQTVITTSDIATKTLKLEGASLPNYTADWGITIKTPIPNCHS